MNLLSTNKNAVNTTETKLIQRHLVFCGLCALTVVALNGSFGAWLQLSFHNDRYTHLWMIPLVSGYMIFEIRRAVFSRLEWSLDGIALAATGVAVIFVGYRWSNALDQVSLLTLTILGALTICAGIFRICYGRHAWQAARFPILFLLFAVPVPSIVLDKVISFLQQGSAAVVEGLFTLTLFPYVRDGLRFYLPGLTIEIAPQCSGIRSSTVLVIVAVLVAYYLLRTRWRRLLLVVLVLPLVLFKNGLRIATLSLLAVRVDRKFITGSLHHDGGFVFFGLMLLVVAVVCWALRKSEAGKVKPSAAKQAFAGR